MQYEKLNNNFSDVTKAPELVLVLICFSQTSKAFKACYTASLPIPTGQIIPAGTIIETATNAFYASPAKILAILSHDIMHALKLPVMKVAL